jgi:hypothetical protein
MACGVRLFDRRHFSILGFLSDEQSNDQLVDKRQKFSAFHFSQRLTSNILSSDSTQHIAQMSLKWMVR